MYLIGRSASSTWALRVETEVPVALCGEIGLTYHLRAHLLQLDWAPTPQGGPTVAHAEQAPPNPASYLGEAHLAAEQGQLTDTQAALGPNMAL